MKILRPFDSLKFVVAAIVCTFILNVAHAATLPAGYTELQYLEFDNQSYLNTGIIPEKTQKIELKARLVTDDSSLFGAGQNTNNRTQLYMYQNYISLRAWSGSTPIAKIPYTRNQIYDIAVDFTNGILTMDNNSVSFAIPSAMDITSPIYINVDNVSGNLSGGIGANAYYSFKVWNSGNLIQNLVPARRDSDGVLGMYDLADSNPATAFHTNAGTGTFVAGPAVPIKIATTRYNEQQFAPVETRLDAARTVINDLITQMQTNAVNVSKLAVEKQTRPNATCPVGKNCLLVTDPTGAENWYEIIGADAVESSSNVPDYFSFTTTPLNAGDSVGFYLNPSGTFTVDWGDGTTPQVIERTNPFNSEEEDSENSRYTHTYANAGPKTIKITGRATGYSTYDGVFNFEDTSQIASIDGSLGAIFPTLGNASGQQPRFKDTFAMSNFTSIPENLFSGVTGAVDYMFERTFNESQITSIPAGLFSGITGAAEWMFYDTFSGAQITSIPAGLFSGITGAAEAMFYGTFNYTPITSIPAGLFSGVTGAAPYMFSYTFRSAPITSIPAGLFSGVTGAAPYMFSYTFDRASITSIPENLFSGITGAAYSMFENTFASTQITSIPENLFSGVTGAVPSMFKGTFGNCENLSGYIPESTFAGLIQNNSPDANEFMDYIFYNSTGLATTCPQNTTEVSTPYRSKYWNTDYNGNYAVMCRPN